MKQWNDNEERQQAPVVEPNHCYGVDEEEEKKSREQILLFDVSLLVQNKDIILLLN